MIKNINLLSKSYPAVSIFSIISPTPARSKLLKDRVFLELYGFFRVLAEEGKHDSDGDVSVKESWSCSGVNSTET